LKGRQEQGGSAPKQQQTMPRLQVWPRRQEIPPQQATTGPAPIEGVERTEAVMVHSQQRTEFAQRNPYAMNVDRRRNCYNCGGFGHIAKHYRNRGIENKTGEGRRLEYGGNERQRRIKRRSETSNLNGKQDLILLN